MSDSWLRKAYCRELRSIHWQRKSKWLSEERLYSLACANLTNERKVFILGAMAWTDVANLKSIDAPQSYMYLIRSFLNP